ncbi:unnamed protein product [Rangifer tarandus platyrhynchus]|uniref:Uncharacterized protein n=2 Tax=Rangifer tarandus platyrhynchus TaxID=3082113 RepID=A0ABN8ZNP9_RANTA|nr:unnamed protein product [Rangifer tarandus platyrhynchus]
MFSKSSQNIYVLVDLKMKHLPWKHIGFLVCGLPESIPLKLFQGFEKNDEQFIILTIVFIAQTTVSLCSRESGDLKLRALSPPFPFSFLTNLIAGLLPSFMQPLELSGS